MTKQQKKAGIKYLMQDLINNGLYALKRVAQTLREC